MAFLGLRKWSTPVRAQAMPIDSFLHPAQIVRPLWPFMIGGSIVAYTLYNLQEQSVRCAFRILSLSLSLLSQPDASAAEAWRNDARNPYAAQIARESIH